MDLTIAFVLIIGLAFFQYNLREDMNELTKLTKEVIKLNEQLLPPIQMPRGCSGVNTSNRDILFKTNFDTLTVDIMGKLKDNS